MPHGDRPNDDGTLFQRGNINSKPDAGDLKRVPGLPTPPPAAALALTPAAPIPSAAAPTDAASGRMPSRPRRSQTNQGSIIRGGKHVFLSYQWDVQEQVKKIKSLLDERQIKCTGALSRR